MTTSAPTGPGVRVHALRYLLVLPLLLVACGDAEQADNTDVPPPGEDVSLFDLAEEGDGVLASDATTAEAGDPDDTEWPEQDGGSLGEDDGQVTPPKCDDWDPCTGDVWDEIDGCLHPPLTGAPCDDGNVCTTSDTCQIGVCVGGAAVCECIEALDCAEEGTPCGGAWSCVDGTCEIEAGQSPDDCDDGNPCTSDECIDGFCRYRCSWLEGCECACVDDAFCEMSATCTVGWCDKVTGKCSQAPKACTHWCGESCYFGMCREDVGCVFIPNPIEPCLCLCSADEHCADGSPCTVDYCDVDLGICFNGLSTCDDDDACTLDGCDEETGECSSLPFKCPDADSACTTVSCLPSLGCVYQDLVCPQPGPCEVAACDPATGECVISPNCDDGDACTVDACDEATGACTNEPKTCPKAPPCQVATCDPETAACGTAPVDCDDGDACTADGCDPATGACTHEPADCGDGDPCTVDACDSVGGCQHAATCDDGNPCTDDLCAAGSAAEASCTHSPASCDDGDPCTYDACLPLEGCEHFSAWWCGKPCAVAGEPCYSTKPCLALACMEQGGELTCQYVPPDCDDGDPCTVDQCHPSVAGGCFHVPAACPGAE